MLLRLRYCSLSALSRQFPSQLQIFYRFGSGCQQSLARVWGGHSGSEAASPYAVAKMEVHQFKQVVTRKICPTCGQEFKLADEDSLCPKDGSMLAPLIDDPYIGQTIAETSRILELLGSGAYGTVYKARQMPLDRLVAVKIMQPQLVSDLDKVRRFEREARALSQLVHPNIVGIYDYGLLPSPYMIMEYVDGRQLAYELSLGALPFETIVSIGAQVCAALQNAHEQNVVHRDLKPSNIMLLGNRDEACTVKILDFGLAKLLEENDAAAPALTKSGEIIGSPPYMSPEQCLGKPLDRRSDIYSLGCILYEMLTGERPFTANSAAEYMNKHCLDTPRPFLDVNAKLVLPQQVEDIVLKALEKDPDKRYQSMAQLKTDLEECLKIAIKSGVGILKKKKARRVIHKSRIALIVGTVVLVSAGVFVWQCFPAAVPEAVWQNAYDAGEKALQNRDFAYAADQFKKAIVIADNMGGADQQRRHFSSLVKLLETYKAAGKWEDAAKVNDQLLQLSRIEDKRKRYGGGKGRNGLAFYFPSKWQILKGDPNWNDGSRFRASQVLQNGEMQVQVYRDNVQPEVLAEIEQQLYAKLFPNYKLVYAGKERIAGGGIDGYVRDFEIDGDLAVTPKKTENDHRVDSKAEPLELKAWQTGDAVEHRHVFFGKPGKIYKIRVHGDKYDLPHLLRALNAMLASIELIDDQPIIIQNRADLSTSEFYVRSDGKGNSLCIVPAGAKPLPGYDKKLDLGLKTDKTAEKKE